MIFWKLKNKILNCHILKTLALVFLLTPCQHFAYASTISFDAHTSTPLVVDSQVSIKYSGLVFNRSTNTFDSLATLTNTSAGVINGPLSLLLTSILNNSIALTNPSGITDDVKPFINIPLTGGKLPPAQTVNIPLKFSNPNRVRFSFKFSVLQGNLQAAGKQVQLQVFARDAINSGQPLHYSWRVTEGSIRNVDAATTVWTIPQGPGVHFANVLVSNRLGGYTERRIAVFSDDLGIPAPITSTTNFSPPANTGLITETETEFVVAADPNYSASNGLYGFKRAVYIPDLTVPYTDFNSGMNFQSTSDLTGRMNFLNSGHEICCEGDFGGHPHTHVYSDANNLVLEYIAGSAAMQDGGICGTNNKLHGVQSNATATLLDINQNALGNPVRVNNFGDYALPWNPLAWHVKVQCENNSPVVVDIDRVTSVAAPAVFSRASAPTVTTITASLNGQTLGADKALFLPPDSGQPSSNFPRADLFLAFKGIDSHKSACEYYRLIGAVKSCDISGKATGAITFDDWQRKVGIGRYVHSGAQEYSATYINKIDLNLTRNHHAITYVTNGGNGTAAYVCNHLGPKTDSQNDIDLAIDNAINGRNLVACVAMDYGYELDNGVPYVRYYTFAPNGQLLMSVNLDGRGEKYMPGTCVACHGGDNYDGEFPVESRATPNYGGHFLPYDVANFSFSSRVGYRKADQQNAIHELNKIAQTTNLTSIASNLIDSWYKNGTELDESYWPDDWKSGAGTIPGVDVEKLYKHVNAPYCRTCHVAMTPARGSSMNPEEFANWVGTDADTGLSSYPSFKQVICGGLATVQRNHTMPNSLVTFNRMWSDPVAVQLLEQWSGARNCLLKPDPKLQ